MAMQEMMKQNGNRAGWAVIALMWIVAVIVYGSMPERMATHWNASGEANGYSGKVMGLFLIPFIAVLIGVMFEAFPRIDPLRKNIERVRRQFDGFVLLFAIFMTYLFGTIIAWNKGALFSMNMALAPAFALLFYGIGSLLQGIKRNWFIGIRTPWTMSSDGVWDRIHVLGSRLFKLSGVIALLGLVAPRYAIAFVIVPALVSSAVAVVYSYREFKKEKNEPK